MIHTTIQEVTAPPEIVLRALDTMECEASHMNVAAHFREDSHNFVVRVEGEIVAVWGIRPCSALGLQLGVWMYSTPAIEKWPVVVGRLSRLILLRLLSQFPVLVCWVHRDYGVAIHWLEWLGFNHVSNIGEFMEMRIRRGPR